MDSQVKRVGRWDLAKRFTANIGKDIADEANKALKQIGSEAEGNMKKYIRDQIGFGSSEYPWPKLSDAYAAYKKRKKGLSNKTLIATSSMFQSITSIAAYPTVWVGVKRGKLDVGPGGKGKEDVANIAAVMEWGSKKRDIPARPFLRPVNDYMQMKIKSGNLFGKRIIEIMKRKYGL